MSSSQSAQTTKSSPETLQQVLITEKLAIRSCRSPRLALEISVLRELADCLRDPTDRFLRRFVELALEVCQAGSVGVSLLEKTDSGEEIFRWNALSGRLAEFVGGSTPRNWSPCGACLDAAAPILLSYPARAFTYFNEVDVPIVEGLVLPLYASGGRALGTIWVISHEESRKFDEEDLRIMTSLAQLASTGLQIAEHSHELEARSCMVQVSSAIGIALTRRETLRTMLQGCAQALVDHLDARFARVWTVSPERSELILQASAGIYTHLDGPHSRVPIGTLKIGRIASERKPHLTNDVPSDPQISDPEWARAERMISFAGYPLIAHGELVGVMALFARHKLNPETLDVLGSVANGIALGIRQKQAEEQLQLSEQRYRSLVEMSANIVWESNQDGRITKELPSWAAYTGRQFDEYRDSGWIEAFHPADQDRILQAWRDALQTKQEFKGEARIRRHDGIYRDVEIYGVPVLNSDGELREWIGTYTDITDRKLAQETLLRTNEQLREFSHVVAHDLQAPLRHVGTFTQLLAEKYKDHLDSGETEIAGYVQDGVARMHDLIRSLLEYAEAGKPVDVVVPVDTGEIVQQVCQNLRPYITEADAAIVFAGLPVVGGHRVRVTQLFQNLLSNSLKYRGSQQLHIKICATRSGGDWLFSVQDTGEGIEPKHFENIFKPLKRLHGQEIPGTGIGLALCARIVQEAGGRIWVESELHRGSTFYFTWPCYNTVSPDESFESAHTGSSGLP